MKAKHFIAFKDGWLVIDKPKGLSSGATVGRVRKILNIKKVGHAGTLDPLATGILPIAFGEATKTVSFVMDKVKTYQFSIKWGIGTLTGDEEGEIVGKSNYLPEVNKIKDVLLEFIGEISQIPHGVPGNCEYSRIYL